MNWMIVFAASALITGTLPKSETIPVVTRGMNEAEIISLWNAAEQECAEDLSGEVIDVCLARTELADVLVKRGFCQDALTNRWTRCLIGE